MQPSDAEAARTAELAARRSYGKLVAFLAARTRDVAGAEDALSEAFAAALAHWPVHGTPANPEAWLFTAARRRLIDAARQRKTGERVAEHLLLLAELAEGEEAQAAIPDERLALMFACAHPAIDAGVHAPLMLQTILGLDAAAIASAFLVAPATMGQRLVRAKAKIRQAGIPLRVPGAAELPGRLEPVLAAIYAAFSEGWSAAAGAETHEHHLAEEAIWLGRLAASLLPGEPEALGLLALMLHAHARRGARRDAQGDYVPLTQQNPAHWNAEMIAEAEALLRHAGTLRRVGRYQLEAAVQSVHAARAHGHATDWPAIVTLYEALGALTGSPVVELNRAVALAEVEGVGAGLAALDALVGVEQLANYQPFWAARAGLLERAGRDGEAATAYQRAIGLETDEAVRRFLQRRRDRLPAGGSAS